MLSLHMGMKWAHFSFQHIMMKSTPACGKSNRNSHSQLPEIQETTLFKKLWICSSNHDTIITVWSHNVGKSSVADSEVVSRRRFQPRHRASSQGAPEVKGEHLPPSRGFIVQRAIKYNFEKQKHPFWIFIVKLEKKERKREKPQ